MWVDVQCEAWAAIEISSPFGSICLFVYADKLTISSGTALASCTAFQRLWGISDIFKRLNCLLQSCMQTYWNNCGIGWTTAMQNAHTYTESVITVIWGADLSVTFQVTFRRCIVINWQIFSWEIFPCSKSTVAAGYFDIYPWCSLMLRVVRWDCRFQYEKENLFHRKKIYEKETLKG